MVRLVERRALLCNHQSPCLSYALQASWGFVSGGTAASSFLLRRTKKSYDPHLGMRAGLMRFPRIFLRLFLFLSVRGKYRESDQTEAEDQKPFGRREPTKDFMGRFGGFLSRRLADRIYDFLHSNSRTIIIRKLL